MSKISFDTSEFQRSHLRTPRGRGSWAFTFGNRTPNNDLSDVLFSPSGTFTEAKAWARIEAARLGFVGTIFAQP